MTKIQSSVCMIPLQGGAGYILLSYGAKIYLEYYRNIRERAQP